MKWFQQLSLTTQTICRVLVAMFFVLLIAGLLVTLLVYPFEKPLAYALGLALGICSSILKITMMERSISRSLDMEGHTAKRHASAQALLRYLATIALLVFAAFFRHIIGLIGVILGILSLQFAAYIAAHRLKNVNLDPPIEPAASPVEESLDSPGQNGEC